MLGLGTSKQIQLGDMARDTVSGFQGIVNARTVYLAGCVRIQIAPQKLKDDGKPADTEWFDEGLVETITENGAGKKRATGGPADAPTVRQDAIR